MMKYEVLVEDYHGHFFRHRFEANTDKDALKQAHEYGYRFFQ